LFLFYDLATTMTEQLLLPESARARSAWVKDEDGVCPLEKVNSEIPWREAGPPNHLED